MQIYKTEKVTKTLEVDEVIEHKLICNKCGRTLDFLDEKYKEAHELELELDSEKFYYLSFCGGYYSKFPRDGEEIEFHICENCLEELYNSFKVK